MCGGPNGICIGRLEHVKLGFGCSPNWENGKKLEGKKLPKRTKTIKMCCVRESPNSMPQIQPSLARVQGRTKKTHTATWLILPVVIRSSQRLSHACLSVNIILWNCERLIISVIVYLIVPYYLDNRSNSRANTCVNTHRGSSY